jgi:hypothetical protein
VVNCSCRVKGAAESKETEKEPHGDLQGQGGVGSGQEGKGGSGDRRDLRYPTQYLVTQWKKQLLERASDAFEKEMTPEDGLSAKELSAKIGQLVMEHDFLAVALGKLHGASARK